MSKPTKEMCVGCRNNFYNGNNSLGVAECWSFQSAEVVTRFRLHRDTPLRGELLAKTAVNQILAHPATWDQRNWHSACGTKHCFAGWCQLLSGKPQNSDTALNDAAEALGLTPYESKWYFRPTASLAELHYLAANFNRAGFNRAGFNRDGFDRDGFDRAGFDRAGFNRDGFDRAGERLKPFDL